MSLREAVKEDHAMYLVKFYNLVLRIFIFHSLTYLSRLNISTRESKTYSHD